MAQSGQAGDVQTKRRRRSLRDAATRFGRRPRTVIHKLVFQTSPQLGLVLAALVVAGSLVQPLFAVATGRLVAATEAAAQGAERTPVIVMLGVVALLYVAQQVMSPAREAVTATLGRRIDDGIRSWMMRTMLTPNGVAHLEEPSIQDKLALARGVAWGVTPGAAVQGAAMLWLARLSAIGSLAIVASFRWWIAVLLLVASLVTLRSKRRSFLNMTTIYSRGAERLRRSGYFRDVALSNEAAKETRVFGLAPWAIARFDAAWLDTMREVWRERKRGAVVVVAGLAAKAVATFVAFLYVASAGTTGDVGVGEVVTVMQALVGTASLSMVLGNPELMLEQGAAALEPAMEVEERVSANQLAAIAGQVDATGLPRHSILFEGVTFTYPGREEAVFQELDLEVPAGRSLAIVGVNGAGKTTFVKLLARLYDPGAGRILVDGIDLREMDPQSWHRRLAVIFQDFGRYAVTARENVALAAFGEPVDATVLDQVAQRAGLQRVIAGWEHGWDSVLNRQFDAGVELSGGEWQRVALARALFAVERGASVLILDEPTAQLDVRSEAELYDSFLDLTRGLTTVVISHRFSTVRRADRIVVIDAGKVVEAGTHDELIEQRGHYAEMFELQAARFAG